jgi:threonine dehydratase
VECTVVVPEAAPETKITAIERLGARIVFAPYEDWMQIFRSRSYEGMKGLFIDDFSDPAVRAGQGTIGLEILEELPDVEAVVIPYGGGGLSCGIAPGLRALKPDTKLYACEVETAAPLAASLAAGKPVEIDHTPSFVDGIGAPFLFPGMWELASQLLDGSLVVGLAEVASAIGLLAERNRIIAEGAGAESHGFWIAFLGNEDTFIRKCSS